MEKERLSYKVLLARYGENEGMLREGGRLGSVWWKDVCALGIAGASVRNGWLSESCQKVVGDGHGTSFWQKPWVEGGEVP